MLFLVTENDFYEDNPHARLMPEFTGVSNECAKFVVFYCDWSSPYRKLPQKEKFESALAASGLIKGVKKTKEGELVAANKHIQVKMLIELYPKLMGIEQELKNLEFNQQLIERTKERALGEVEDVKDYAVISTTLLKLTEINKKLEENINISRGVEVKEKSKKDEDEDDSWNAVD